MAKKQKVWPGKENSDGWELWKQVETGNTPHTIFTLVSPGGIKSGWRLYGSRTSPHTVEMRFEKAD